MEIPGSALRLRLHLELFWLFLGKSALQTPVPIIFSESPQRSKISEMVRARRGLPPLEDDGSDQGFISSSGLGVPLQPRNPARSTATNQRFLLTLPLFWVTNYDELRKETGRSAPASTSIAPRPLHRDDHQAGGPAVTPASASGYDELRNRRTSQLQLPARTSPASTPSRPSRLTLALYSSTQPKSKMHRRRRLE